MMSVVQPAYHCGPNGGQGSFLPSASRRFSCVLVLATVGQSVSLCVPSCIHAHVSKAHNSLVRQLDGLGSVKVDLDVRSVK